MKKNTFVIIIFLLFFTAGFILIKSLGLLEILSILNNNENLNYSLILLIGFLASFHCIGMCGGLVITYTANNLTKKRDDYINCLYLNNKINNLLIYSISISHFLTLENG